MEGHSRKVARNVEPEKFHPVTFESRSAGSTTSVEVCRVQDVELHGEQEISILWPDGTVSHNKLTQESVQDSPFYDRDAGCSFTDVHIYHCIQVMCNGALIKNVRLDKVQGIKIYI